MKRIALISIVLGMALLAVPSAMAQVVIPSDSVAYGRTYSEWSAAWWQWVGSIPVASHPLFDNADCSIGQSGPVWFLGGKFCQNNQICTGTATRSCSVPAGKALFFPVLNIEDSAPEEPNWGCGDSIPPLKAGTIAEMRQCLAPYIDGAYNLGVNIDGYQVHNPKAHFRVQSVEFEITLPEDNWFSAIGEGPFAPGTYSPVVDDGVYVMLAPLSPGPHTLHFHGTFPNGFKENITYNLTVTR